MNYQKVQTSIGKIFSPENMEKLQKVMEFIGEQGKVILEGADAVAEGIDGLSKWVENNTNIPCEMYQLEKLGIDELKNIITETKTEASVSVALLNSGRNKNDELELFLQHLDADKKAIDTNKVYYIRCEIISKELKEKFGDKELLLVNL